MSSSKTYTQGHSESVLASHASRTASTSAAYLLPHLKPTDKILDIGCGPGTITVTLAEHVPQGHITGTDFSADVIESAKKRTAESLPSNCHFEVASVFSLPYDDASFDVVHAHQVLIHLAEPVAALKEMRRVCKPGGLIATREGDWDSTIVFPSSAALEKWKATSDSIFRKDGGSEPNAGRHLIQWAIAAGFPSEGISYSSSNQAYAGQPAAARWGKTQASRFDEQSWRDKAAKAAGISPQDVDQIVAAWKEWSEKPDAVYSIVCGELLARR